MPSVLSVTVTPTPPVVKVKRWYHHLAGLSFSVLSALFLSTTGAIVKGVKGQLHPAELGVYRFGSMVLFVLPVLVHTFRDWRDVFGPPRLLLWVLLRGLCGGTALVLKYTSFQAVPLGDTTAISLAAPTVIAFLAWALLRERVGWVHVVCLLVTALGIGITARLDILFSGTTAATSNYRSEPAYLYGMFCALGATLIMSMSFVAVRRLKSLHSSVILFNFGWIATVETACVTLSPLGGGFQIGNLWDDTLDSVTSNCGLEMTSNRTLAAEVITESIRQNSLLPWASVGICFLSYYGQFFMTLSLQVEEAALASVTRSGSEVIIAFMLQWLIYDQRPDAYSLGGCSLILVSVLCIAARKTVQTAAADHWSRRRLRWLTL